MNIFISYSSGYAEICERLRLAFVGGGDHAVFVDRRELTPGLDFDTRIREAIAECDLFVFLVSPESVAPGSYALAELSMAQARWPHPSGHVLPVFVEPTPTKAIPPYVRAVTILKPQGDLVAETLHAVARLQAPRSSRRWAMVVMIAVAAAAIGGVVLNNKRRTLEAEAAQREAQAAQVEAQAAQVEATARQLCESGDHALAWQRYDEAVARYPNRPTLRTQREDCAMRWLRDIRVRDGEQTFTGIVERVLPVLVEGAQSADAQRAADLEAHLGWADFLRFREGAGNLRPDAHYRKALERDPANVFAHAMWGHWIMVKSGPVDDARRHFTAAVAAQRERPYVRSLQFAALLYHYRVADQIESARLADEMRRNGEPVDAAIKERLWGRVYQDGVSTDRRAEFLAGLGDAGHAATFQWLYPQDAAPADRRLQWQFIMASLEEAAGERASARARYEALKETLERERRPGSMLTETVAALKRLAERPAKR